MNYYKEYTNLQNMRVFEYQKDKYEKLLQKWSSVIKNIGLSNKVINIELSIFYDIYQHIDKIVPRFITYESSPKWQRHDDWNKPTPPSNFITFEEACVLFKKDIDNFIIEDNNSKLKIVSEYFNAVNGKRGLLLENNIRVEDGMFINPKHQDKINKELKKIINLRIEYILKPETRKIFDRKNKLKRIIK